MTEEPLFRLVFKSHRLAVREYELVGNKAAIHFTAATMGAGWTIVRIEPAPRDEARCIECGCCKHDHTGWTHEWTVREESPATPAPGGQG